VQPQVEKARAGDFGLGHFIETVELERQHDGNVARPQACRLGQHHRGVGGEIAMAGIARRFDSNGAGIEPGRQVALRHQRGKGIGDMGGKTRIEIQFRVRTGKGYATPTARRRQQQ
jgi:hypothetical protein